jgi:uncharacterized surface protein with fasciclin (FAS1) repeats
MNRVRTPLFALLGIFLLAACSDFESENSLITAPDAVEEARAPAPGDLPIAKIAIDFEGEFDELVGALSYVDAELDAGLVDLFLTGTDQFTVFAPTDDAFQDLYGLLSAVLGAEITEITDVPAAVVLDVLLYHVAEGRRAANSVVPPARSPRARTVETLLGETFQVRGNATIQDGLTGIREYDAAILVGAGLFDISASNGIIHVIDQVIVPPSVVAALTQ